LTKAVDGPSALMGRTQRCDAKSTHLAGSLQAAGLHGGDSMNDSIEADPVGSTPSIVPRDVVCLSDDECVVRLARAIEQHDPGHLDEIALLIGRLVVTIE
jgi:hypothetical protein